MTDIYNDQNELKTETNETKKNRGRPKKYFTLQEKKEANDISRRKYQNKYYEKNKDKFYKKKNDDEKLKCGRKPKFNTEEERQQYIKDRQKKYYEKKYQKKNDDEKLKCGRKPQFNTPDEKKEYMRNKQKEMYNNNLEYKRKKLENSKKQNLYKNCKKNIIIEIDKIISKMSILNDVYNIYSPEKIETIKKIKEII